MKNSITPFSFFTAVAQQEKPPAPARYWSSVKDLGLRIGII